MVMEKEFGDMARSTFSFNPQPYIHRKSLKYLKNEITENKELDRRT